MQEMHLEENTNWKKLTRSMFVNFIRPHLLFSWVTLKSLIGGGGRPFYHRRPGSEDPHWRERKFFVFLQLRKSSL